MEALAAAGLASNVIQFIDFTAVLFRIYQDLRYKAASSENDDFRVIAEHLKPIAERISDSLQAISTSQSSSTASPQEQVAIFMSLITHKQCLTSRIEQAIRSVADRCCELTKTLLNCLAACELKPGQNASRIQRTKILFRTMRSKSEIRDYVQRLETLREELILHTVLDSQQQVAEIRSSHSTKSDITRVLGKVEDLNDPLRRLDRESKTQYTVITNSIDILRRDNAQLHAETASKSTSNMQAALSKLDSIQQSIDALQLHQRNVPEPTAQKDVGDSCFEPGVPRRNTPYTAPPSLLHVGLQQHLSDYMKTMIREINEEIQGTMRGELGKAQTDMNRVLNEITEAMPEVPRSRHGSTGSSDLIYQCPNSPYELHPNAVEQKRNIPHRSPKENTTLLYRYKKEGSTGVGVFSLITCKKVVFRLTQPPLELYDLEVRFTPNSQLLSTGLSLTYHTTTIARQTPEFGFQPQTYRVLDDSHEVWSIISRGDTRRMQDLLSQSVISTSDRHVNGNTLLMVSDLIVQIL
ncbi:hypothetical protein GGR56DRAFT_369769 [Xylariaceae sp. FL0804]|nr:hypothetical protein GGR56DRAFT_369769 [Xylariaceae sp. FL0804]